MTANIHEFFVAFDALVSELSLRFRKLLKWAVGVLFGVQALLMLNLPEMGFLNQGRWPKVVGMVNALLAYYTIRSERQAKDLAEVKRVGGSEAMARVPTPPSTPLFPPSGPVGPIPTSEMPTPHSMPVLTRKP